MLTLAYLTNSRLAVCEKQTHESGLFRSRPIPDLKRTQHTWKQFHVICTENARHFSILLTAERRRRLRKIFTTVWKVRLVVLSNKETKTKNTCNNNNVMEYLKQKVRAVTEKFFHQQQGEAPVVEYSRKDAYLNFTHKVLVWDDPALSWSVLLIFHFLFWYDDLT